MTVGSRNPNQPAPALTGTERVEVSQLDLLDPQSIDAFAARWLESGRPLHILINGAGASGGPVRDARGYEKHFATNHLGHFLVDLGSATRTARCPRCPRGERVVGRSAVCRHSVDDPNFTDGQNLNLAYAQSKTANVLFAVELDRRWAEDKIRGYAGHPGVVAGTKLNSSARADAS